MFSFVYFNLPKKNIFVPLGIQERDGRRELQQALEIICKFSERGGREEVFKISLFLYYSWLLIPLLQLSENTKQNQPTRHTKPRQTKKKPQQQTLNAKQTRRIVSGFCRCLFRDLNRQIFFIYLELRTIHSPGFPGSIIALAMENSMKNRN